MFTGMTITFLREFGSGLWIALLLLLSLAVVITLIGQYAGRKEGWSRFESFYWSFVTATTLQLLCVQRRSRCRSTRISV